jgi:hypothetical protein
MEYAPRARRGQCLITSIRNRERATIAIRKYVVGDRGGRTRNDFVTSRVRLRMGRDHEYINQERMEH